MEWILAFLEISDFDFWLMHILKDKQQTLTFLFIVPFQFIPKRVNHTVHTVTLPIQDLTIMVHNTDSPTTNTERKIQLDLERRNFDANGKPLWKTFSFCWKLLGFFLLLLRSEDGQYGFFFTFSKAKMNNNKNEKLPLWSQYRQLLTVDDEKMKRAQKLG